MPLRVVNPDLRIFNMHLRMPFQYGITTLRKKHVAIKPVAHSNQGRFRIRSGKIIKPGPYRVTALHKATEAPLDDGGTQAISSGLDAVGEQAQPVCRFPA